MDIKVLENAQEQVLNVVENHFECSVRTLLYIQLYSSKTAAEE